MPQKLWLALALTAALPGVVQAQPEELKQCVAPARRAGMPAALMASMYLSEWNSPAFTIGMACVADRNGVMFRYLPGGLFGNEGFEIKGKSTLRVWVTHHKMDSERAPLLVPVEYEFNGGRFEVTRTNLQLLAFHMRSALNNE